MRPSDLTARREEAPPSTQSFQPEGRGIVDSSGQGFYVVRHADDELFERLSRREPCYVLAPRQIGKSSLRIRTQQRLRAGGVLCVSVDLTSVGSGASADEWYFSIAATIHEELELPGDLEDFWRRHRRMSPVRRFRQFLHDLVLGDVDGAPTPRPGAPPEEHEGGPPVVIFLDEIDVTLALPFSRDDFFGLIRSAREARAESPRWGRLTFCLIGVAAPLDLVADPERTPFNNSFEVRLDDFSRAEARTFLPGLARSGKDPEALLDAVLSWTAGHPALTQRVCYHLARQRSDAHAKAERERVDDLIHELFLSGGRINDPILLDAERRFAGDRPDARIPVMLHLYRRLLDGEDVPADGNNPRQFGLRIAGLAAERVEDGRALLRTRSRIFAGVFNHAWVEEKLARRFLTEPLQIWKDSGKKDDHVLRGDSLRIALAWARGRDDVTPEEHEFLQASLEVESREQADRQQGEVERARRERAEQKVRAQRRVVSILALSFALLAGAMIFMILLYQEKERALAANSAALEQEKKANLLLRQGHEQRLARTREERERARASYEEARRKREESSESYRRADEAADRAEADAAAARDDAARGLLAWWKANRAADAAQARRKEAEKLREDAQLASKEERERFGLYADADKAVAVLEEKPPQASVASSLAESIQAEQGEASRLRGQLEEQVAALTSARAEIARLRGVEKDLGEKLDKQKLDYEIAKRELNALQRFATPPPPPPPAKAPEEPPSDFYD